MNRRVFLKTSPLAVTVPVLMSSPLFRTLFSQDDDPSLCARKFELAASLNLGYKSIGEAIIEIGKSFLGTDYVANALEQPGEERLVINLKGLDCVTFYENALVFARCIKLKKTTFEDYKAQLQFIRYRGGVINGYPSRLHYSCDYFYDNEKRGVLKNVTKSIGGVRYKKMIDFMSTHPESYRQLKERPELIKMIRAQETAINKRSIFHLPKVAVARSASKIHNGDILAITTDIPGIDVSHTGIAIWQNNELHLMHAPITGSKVQITEKTLAEYLAASSKRLGVIVARPVEPA
jgi:hypothetical protein